MLAEALSFSSYSPQRGTWPQVCRVLLARDAVPLHPPGQCSSQSVVYRLKVEIFIRTPVLEYKANVQKGLESSDLSFTHTILLCCGVLRSFCFSLRLNVVTVAASSVTLLPSVQVVSLIHVVPNKLMQYPAHITFGC